MKGRTILGAAVVAALFAAPNAETGQIVENPARPTSPDAGRVVKIAEEWRITDEGAAFFLDRPHSIQPAGDGSIFLVDRDQILRFSAEGKFLKNILRLGQGPGEVTPQRGGARPYLLVQGYDLYISDTASKRCWRTDLDGRLGEEFSVPRSDRPGLIGVIKEGLLFWKLFFPPRRDPVDGRELISKGEFIDLPQTLTVAAWERGKEKDIFTVTNRTFVSPRMTYPAHMTAALSPDGRRFYFVLGLEYLVQEVDLASGTVVRKFKRACQRVPPPPRKPLEGRAAQVNEEDRRKGWLPPDPEFLADVPGLRVVGDLLWVSTSTRDEVKGTLIDVFDREGRYVDCFWTGKSWGPVYDGFVFCSEKGPDAAVSVVKYKIVK